MGKTWRKNSSWFDRGDDGYSPRKKNGYDKSRKKFSEADFVRQTRRQMERDRFGHLEELVLETA